VIATGEVTTLAGLPGTWGGKDGTGSAALFYNPAGVASDHAGNLFVADMGNELIRKIVIATAEVTTLAGPSGSPIGTEADGIGPAAIPFG
jgi:DNA-binding beta-propeller fold protein YncE